MLGILGSFIADRSGNYAMIAGILALPVIGGVGVAVDYARLTNTRAALLNAADAAAAGAVSQSSPTYRNGGTFTADWTQAQAEADALALFRANVANNVGYRIETVTTTIGKAGRRISAEVDFTAKVPMTFMQLFGQPDATITGRASAAVDTAAYIDFHLLLDNSPSMGLGATTGDIKALEDVTLAYEKSKDKESAKACAFACHNLDQPTTNYYSLAREAKVTLRIDVVSKAAQNLFDKAASMRLHDGQFRMALYSFGAKAEAHKLTAVAPLSADLEAGKAMAATIDLMTTPKQNYDNDKQSSFDTIFAGLNDAIPTPGTGESAASRQQIAFIVSDGVADQTKAKCTEPVIADQGNRCQEPIDPKICKALKDRGVKVAVLYTTYQPVNESWYNKWIHPFHSKIATKMEECATPGYFFEVGPSSGIAEAMEALFLKVIGNPRITS